MLKARVLGTLWIIGRQGRKAPGLRSSLLVYEMMLRVDRLYTVQQPPDGSLSRMSIFTASLQLVPRSVTPSPSTRFLRPGLFLVFSDIYLIRE